MLPWNLKNSSSLNSPSCDNVPPPAGLKAFQTPSIRRKLMAGFPVIADKAQDITPPECCEARATHQCWKMVIQWFHKVQHFIGTSTFQFVIATIHLGKGFLHQQHPNFTAVGLCKTRLCSSSMAWDLLINHYRQPLATKFSLDLENINVILRNHFFQPKKQICIYIYICNVCELFPNLFKNSIPIYLDEFAQCHETTDKNRGNTNLVLTYSKSRFRAATIRAILGSDLIPWGDSRVGNPRNNTGTTYNPT